MERRQNNLTCQCEHCKEIVRQQERLIEWQKLNSKLEKVAC